MPTVDALEQYLWLLESWETKREQYRNLPVNPYTYQYITERLAESEQRIADLQILIQEHLVAWAARRPPPPPQQ